MNDNKITEINTHTFSFGEAIDRLKNSEKVARKGWNGKGMFIFLAICTDICTDADIESIMHPDPEIDTPLIQTNPSIIMKTADNHLTVGWVPSQVDMLAEDWVVIK